MRLRACAAARLVSPAPLPRIPGPPAEGLEPCNPAAHLPPPRTQAGQNWWLGLWSADAANGYEGHSSRYFLAVYSYLGLLAILIGTASMFSLIIGTLHAARHLQVPVVGEGRVIWGGRHHMS